MYSPPPHRIRPWLESLEDRYAPALLTVNTLADNTTGGDGDLTLREAIVAVNTQNIAGLPCGQINLTEPLGTNDTIQFAASLFGGGPQTLLLNGTALSIRRSMTIDGPSAGLAIDANDVSQVFLVNDNTASVQIVTIRNLTISRGNRSGGSGGGILNEENLTVQNSTFSGNSAASGSGGGIRNAGTLTVANSTFSGNSAPSGSGGGINNSGTLTVANSTFSGNSVPSGSGGGIYNTGTLTVLNSTFTANTGGAGIYVQAGSATLHNTIVVGNLSGTQPSDARGLVALNASSSNNLFGINGSGGLANGVNGNQVGIDPTIVLDPILTDNGGPTQTHALLPGSPAIDAGSDALVPVGVTTDQRGFSRFVDFPGVGATATVDIGAFEVQIAPNVTLSATDPTANENASSPGNQAIWTLTRSGDLDAPLTVQLSQTLGNAAEAADFTLAAGSGGTFNAGTLTFAFAAGSSTGIIVLTAVNDTEAEADETVTLSLVDAADYDLGSPTSGVVTIPENDFPIIVFLTASDSTADENAASPGNQAVWTLTRTGDLDAPLTVQLSQTLGSAVAADFTLAAGSCGTFNAGMLTFAFAAGSSTGTIVLTAVNDTEAEADETVTLSLVDTADYDLGSPTSGIVTITENDLVITFPPIIVAGADVGSAPRVRVFDAQSHALIHNFLAYQKAFKGGVRVAAGDVTGDGVPDVVTVPGIGIDPRVKIFDGTTGQQWTALPGGFIPFKQQPDDAYVAVGNFDADPVLEIVVSKGLSSGPRVKVFDVAGGVVTQMIAFQAFAQSYGGGITVAAADLDGLAGDEIVVGQTVGGTVRVFGLNGTSPELRQSFKPFGRNYDGGVFVAAGDLDGDARFELVIGRNQGNPVVRVFDASDAEQIDQFPAYSQAVGGVRLALLDRDGDGVLDHILTAPGKGNQDDIRLFDGLFEQVDTLPHPSFVTGVFVAGSAGVPHG